MCSSRGRLRRHPLWLISIWARIIIPFSALKTSQKCKIRDRLLIVTTELSSLFNSSTTISGTYSSPRLSRSSQVLSRYRPSCPLSAGIAAQPQRSSLTRKCTHAFARASTRTQWLQAKKDSRIIKLACSMPWCRQDLRSTQVAALCRSRDSHWTCKHPYWYLSLREARTTSLSVQSLLARVSRRTVLHQRLKWFLRMPRLW